MPHNPSRRWWRASGTPARGNPFGIAEALFGLAAGLVVSGLALGVYDSSAHLPSGSATFGDDVVSLFALWLGFVGAAVVASRLHRPGSASGGGTGSFADDYGVRIRPLVDIPLGIVVGVAAQYLLVPLLELPLQPFVPRFSQRLGHPTRQLLGPASSGGTGELVVIALLVCVGSPLVEELFFRGLLLRGLLGRLGRLGRFLGPALSILVTGLVFALVHFEALQFLGLAGLGVVLSFLSWRTGRLGPCVVAHMAFNTVTVIAFVAAH